MTSTLDESSPYLRIIVPRETVSTLIERLTACVAASSEWRRDEAAEVEWAASVGPQQPPVYSFVVAPAPPGWTQAQRLWLMPDKRGDDLIANTIFPELDGNYLVQLSSAKATWLPWQNLVLDTNLGLSQYAGLGGEFDQSIVLWNAGVGYKFLKGNAGEVKLMIADILNQNNSISRTVNEFYIEDNETQVLGRYVMLNFTYRLRNFRL